jgi:hypothetical protein
MLIVGLLLSKTTLTFPLASTYWNWVRVLRQSATVEITIKEMEIPATTWGVQ